MKDSRLLVVGLVLLAGGWGCAVEDAADQDPEDQSAEEQGEEELAAEPRLQAFRMLREARPTLEAEGLWSSQGHLSVRGGVHGPDTRDAESIATEVIAEYSPLFGDPGSVHLETVDVQPGIDTPVTHVRYQQQLAGVPVFQGEVVVHVREDGSVGSFQGRTHAVTAAEDFDSKPSLDLEELETFVRSHFAVDADFAEYSDPELVVWVQDGAARLAWSLSVLAQDFPGTADILVDAHSGEVVLESFATDPLTATACDPFGHSLSINTTNPIGAPFQLHDKTRPAKIRGYDQGGAFTWTQSAPLTDGDNDWCAGAQQEPALGHDNMGKVLDFFQSNFGRSSYNGSGGNIKMGFDASFAGGASAGQWNASSIGSGRFKFGGGLPGQAWMPLDVVGHEFTHAMLHSEGITTGTDESGAIHEHISDVFGTLVEFDFGNAFGDKNFQLGEEVGLLDNNGAPRPVRDMLAPPAGEDHFFEFEAGKNHQNSQILSLPVALLASGGGVHPHSGITVPGIGMAKVRTLYYAVVTNYLAPGNVSFRALGQALSDAAGDAFGDGSDEQLAVEGAFIAAGVTPASVSLVPHAENFPWQSGSTPLVYGSAQASPGVGATSAKMEDGKLWDGSMFGMTPASGLFGHVRTSIDLQLPANAVLPGGLTIAPHLRAEVGFPLIADDSNEALVNVVVRDAAGVTLTNATANVRRDDNTVDIVDIDLEAFAGQPVTVELWVYNLGAPPARPVIFDTLSLVQIIQ